MHIFVTCHAVCVHTAGPKHFWDAGAPLPWDWDVFDSVERRPTLYHTCYQARFCRSGWNDMSVITEVLLENLTFRIPSFKVTHDHRNRHGSIDYLWLLIYGFTLYHFRDKRKFFPPHVFKASTEAVLLEFLKRRWCSTKWKSAQRDANTARWL